MGVSGASGDKNKQCKHADDEPLMMFGVFSIFLEQIGAMVFVRGRIQPRCWKFDSGVSARKSQFSARGERTGAGRVVGSLREQQPPFSGEEGLKDHPQCGPALSLEQGRNPGRAWVFLSGPPSQDQTGRDREIKLHDLHASFQSL